MSAAKLERLLNLTALLLETARPLSAQEIRERLGAYPVELESFRRAFERDKDDLRAMGVPLEVAEVPGRGPGGGGLSHPQGPLPPRPRADARRAGGPAHGRPVVRLDGLSAREGLLKLGGLVGDADDLGLEVGLAGRPAPGPLFGAIAARVPVRFTYKDEVRTVDPYRLDPAGPLVPERHDHARRGAALPARPLRERHRDAGRPPLRLAAVHQRAGRPAGVAAGRRRAGGGQGPGGRAQAPWIVHHRGQVVEERPDGSVVVTMAVTSRENFRSFVLTFLDHAEVLAPPTCGPRSCAGWRARSHDGAERARDRLRARTSAPDRVARLLAVIPWIAAQHGPTLDEVCARFGVTRRKLEEDLTIHAGRGAALHPRHADRGHDRGRPGLAAVRRRVRQAAAPHPEQAVALVAAGTASQGLPGGDSQGPLATALAKLAGVLGLEPGETLSVALGDTRPGVLEPCAGPWPSTVARVLDYYAAGTSAAPATSTRRCSPTRASGTCGWCHSAADHRLPGRPHRRGGGAGGDLRPAATAAGTWTCSTTARDPPCHARRGGVRDGWRRRTRWTRWSPRPRAGCRIRLPVTATPWLERLLVRLGRDARWWRPTTRAWPARLRRRPHPSDVTRRVTPERRARARPPPRRA